MFLLTGQVTIVSVSIQLGLYGFHSMQLFAFASVYKRTRFTDYNPIVCTSNLSNRKDLPE